MIISGNMILRGLANCSDASIFASAAKLNLKPRDVVRSSVACIEDNFWIHFSKLV